jgi:PAS domain S-box-containing protein
VLIFQDIDPLKKSLEQVTQARFYAEALVETVHESLIVLAPDLRLVTANKAFYATFQTTPLQTDGRPLFELDGWEWAEDRLRGLLERVVEGGELVRNLEVEAISRRYGRRILLVSARQVDVPGEQKRAVLLAIEDLTERRAGEKDLRASERRYRQIFEFAREGIWILDGETGEIRDVNPFLAELLGWTAGDLVGRKPWDLPIYESPEEARAVFEEARTRGFAFHPVVRMRKSDGAIIDVEELSTIYAEGADRLVQSNLRDISERRRLEEELRQAQKMDSIGRLAGGLAHDFNNILNIITAYVGLLERGVDAEKEKETLIGIQKAVQRGAAVVRQLLTFARRDETSLRAVDVNDVVREVAAMAKETFPKRTAIELELGSDLPKITADPNHLHQALLNLCVNSRDAIPNKGRITLSTAAVAGEELRRRFADATADRYVRASVADTGDGMPEETRSRIFEPFFTTKGKGEGSGLGLPVVYGIVKNHSGWIDVASEPGKGTTVSLYFPARAEGAGQEREKTEVRSKRQKAGGGEKLMVVDDEKMILDSSRALLEAEGYRVVAAADGEEAVEVFARDGRDVALVLLDLELPRLSGVEVLRRMRQINPAIRFLVTSGRVGSAEQAAIEHAPVLRKPFTADDLLAAIRSALEPRPSPRRRPARGVPASPPG